MKLDIRNNKIDPDSNFARAFQHYAEEAFRDETVLGGDWMSEGVHFGHIRKRIAEDMVTYLRRTNGVIDGWPEPDTGLYLVSTKKFEPDKNPKKHYFHYFGSDGGRASLEEFIPNRPVVKCNNAYEHRYSQLYEETVRKGEYYGRTPGENRKHILLYWLARLPLLYAAITVLLSALAFFGWDYMSIVELPLAVQEGTAQIIAPVVDQVLMVPLLFLVAVPFAFALFVDTVLGASFGPAGVLIGCAAVCGLACGCYWYLNYKWKPRPQNHKEIKRAYNEKKAYRESKEYQDIIAAEEARKAENEEISEQWHRAWFEQYKREHPNRDYYSHKK